MKKLIVIVAAIAAASFSANAQWSINAGYSSSAMKYTAGDYSELSTGYNGFTVGGAYTLPIVSNLAAEFGANVDFATRDLDGFKDTLLDIRIPASLVYSFNFGKWGIAPFAGLDLGAYLVGNETRDNVDSFSLFDEEGVSRFIFDWHAGFRVNFWRMYIGYTFESGITNFCTYDYAKIKAQRNMLTIGYRF